PLPHSPLFPYTTLFRSSGLSALPRNRRDVDDAAVPRAHHSGRRPADGVERAREVRVDYGAPLVVGHAGDEAVACDAGVVDEDRQDRKSTRLNSSHVAIS